MEPLNLFIEPGLLAGTLSLYVEPVIKNEEHKLIQPNMSQIEGGGGKKMSEIQIETFENHWGVSIFQKCLNYKLLSDSIL